MHFDHPPPGVYIVQNTLVEGGGNGWLGEKNENEDLGKKKIKKRERKREEKYIKKKALNMHLLGL